MDYSFQSEQTAYGPLQAPSLDDRRLYGAAKNGGPSWGDWNSSSGGQGYWLLGAATLLVVAGAFMATKSTP